MIARVKNVTKEIGNFVLNVEDRLSLIPKVRNVFLIINVLVALILIRFRKFVIFAKF